jgi:Tol biopolymer transport system component
LAINDGKRSDIWVYEWAHDTLTRLTFSGNNFYPIWTPDGQRITYSSFEKPGVGDLYWTRADGTEGTLRLTETKLLESGLERPVEGARCRIELTRPKVWRSRMSGGAAVLQMIEV